MFSYILNILRLFLIGIFGGVDGVVCLSVVVFLDVNCKCIVVNFDYNDVGDIGVK